MTNKTNEFLYKYRSIDEQYIARTQKIFTDNEVFFARFDQFNDPFDCKYDYSFDAHADEAKAYLQKLIEREMPQLNRQGRRRKASEMLKVLVRDNPKILENLKQDASTMLSELGIFSLSRVPDDLLMWSHYADSHRGFCLQFLDDERDRFIARAQEITYSDEYPVVNPIKDTDHIRMTKVLLTKSNHWSYEKEWRIIDHESGPGLKRFPPDLLVGVIFGCRMAEEHKEQIRDWCRGRGTRITFYQAEQAKTSFSLDIIQL